MHNIPSEERWLLPSDVSAKPQHPGVPLAMRAWPLIAAAAWEAYRETGRGAVMLDAEGRFGYQPGSPCPCHHEAVAAYDPEREVVVALCDGELVRDVIVVAGWPAPPDAARLTPGDRWLLATGDVFLQ
jgi:hypothetical protein